ncbi:MAG: outer membrane protein assembly factor BamC [Betaproteobacteria bacterium]|nr:MAG: outer membrane protein assembly factor BamC [Betaproteobacteria bacterium]
MKRNVVYFVLLALVAGCSSMPEILQGEKIKYKGAGKLPPLEIPPDLTAPSRDDRYAVPDVKTQGSATLSTYNAERGGAVRPGSTELLPNVAKVRIERAGSQRWLVVPEAPEKVWPVLKEFWQGLGFLVKIELPEAGVMETDWAENRAKITDDPIRSVLGKFFDSVYSTGERDKFRTRLERGIESGTTEIYISHRGMVEVYTSATKDSTMWQPRPADAELEAEFLRRLMVRFGVEDARAKAQLASNEVKTERAKLVHAGAGAGKLELTESFDRAWRRVGLALDRVGFTVEDRDRSKGYYFVRYVDPQIDGQKSSDKDKGFLSKLAFWKSDKSEIKAEQYRVVVQEANNISEVQVQNKDGRQDNSDTGRRILSLLHEQLK